MAVDIGPKIGIDGEAEFRKELSNINQQIKTLGSEMKAVTSAFDAGDKSEEALAAQTGVLTRQIEAQEQKLAQLQKGLAASAEKYGENDTKTLRWAQAVNDATAELNSLKAKLSQASGEMDDLEQKTDDAADALKEAESAGSGFGETLKGAILGGGIVSGIQALVGGVKDLVESTTEYRKIQASLEVSSQRAGYSAEETAATYGQLYGVLGDDQTAATATANLQAIGLEQEQLTQLTNAAIGAWASYGDSIPIDGLAEAINETIKVGQVTGTFADALNWAGVSEDDFNAKLEAASTPAERANLVLQQLASQGLVQAGEAWQQNNADLVANNQAQNNLNSTMAEFGEILSPVVANATQGMADLAGGVLGVVRAFQEGGFSAAFSSASELVSSFVGNIVEQAPAMIEAGMGMASDLVDGVVQGLPTVIKGVGDVLTGIFSFLQENGPAVVERGTEILGNLAVGIIQAIPDMVAQLPQVIAGFTGYVASMLPTIAQSGVELLLKLAEGIVQTIPELVAQLPQVINAIADGLDNLMSGITQAGKNIVYGLWEGISGAAGWLLGKIKSWCGGILEGIMSFFGIHSPSTVFRDEVGKYLAQGVGVGFEDEMSGVAARMQRSIPTPKVELPAAAFAGTAAAGGVSAGRYTIEIPVNINGRELYRITLDDLVTALNNNARATGTGPRL